MKFYLSIISLLFSINISAQTLIRTEPQFPTENDSIVVYFDATQGNAGLKGYSGDVYAHTGVITNLSTGGGDWKYVMTNWPVNIPAIKMIRDSEDHYHIVIGKPRVFYSNNQTNAGAIPDAVHILKLAFVFRTATGNIEGKDVGGKDIYAPLYSAGISIILNSPTVNFSYGDPARSPVYVSAGSTVTISATTTSAGTTTLYVNGTQKAQSTTTTISYNYVADEYPGARNNIKILAVDNANHKDSSLFVIMKNPAINNSALPAGNKIGINYGSDPTKVTLALYAPKKNFVYVIGDFGNSDWKVDEAYYMNKYEAGPDSVIWWTTISNLESGREYSYQFLVDGNLRIYDPYTEKILDGSNDQYIPAAVYPNLKAYPAGKTTNPVSVLQTNQPEYSWQVPQFVRPAKEKLVIYEMLVRDFVGTHWYKTIMDTLSYFKNLGVTAIELLPVMEFEGNDSWGYNSATYFAPDKYYGTGDNLKAFIDACHQNGIAVILDIVLNHAYNSNSMAQLYWDNVNSRPAADNPWFNVTAPVGAYTWGNDFNHTSKDTKYFVDRVTEFWLTKYKADGFRFDFTKGFTNVPGEGSSYDASRIAILKRMADKIWNVSPGAYVILEHLCENREETELANYGMMLWGKLNYNYSEAAKGATGTSDINAVSYKTRGWNNPNLVGYMESHDEERLMFNNITSGNISNSNYNVRDVAISLNRMKLAANLFILVPGPKMIWQFGELGYDISINQNGRLGGKPLPWSDGLNYYSNENRRELYRTYAYLNKLKSIYPVFSSTDFALNGYFPVKSLYISHSSMNAAVMGNFDVVTNFHYAQFQSTGTWYEFFTGSTLNVTDVNMSIELQPGEYRLYTSQRINKADIPVGVEDEKSIPENFSLNQNYPNPFNPSTVISYKMPVAGHVTLKVYDFLGREVVTLVDEYQSAGAHNSQFSIQNSHIASGIYFYRLQAGKFISTKKMVLIK